MKRKTNKHGFLGGFLSAFSLFGAHAVERPDFSRGFERDAEALGQDWIAVGMDLGKAMEKFKRDNQQRK